MWKTRDLLVVSVIGVTLGLVLIPYFYATSALSAVSVLLYAPLSGAFFLPSLTSMYIVKCPGTALVGGLVAGLVQVPFNPAGWVFVVFMLIIAGATEVIFLATRYRRFGLVVLMAGGAAAALAPLALVYVPYGLHQLASWVQVALLAEFAVSGALLGGLLAKLLADALARTGVLSGYPIGRGEAV